MSEQAQSVRVDFDAAVEGYNSMPGNKKVSKNKLCKILGISHRTLLNWQNGDGLNSVAKINELIKLSGLKYEDLVKPKK